MEENTNAPAGWYPDGTDGAGARFWDGQAWPESQAHAPDKKRASEAATRKRKIPLSTWIVGGLVAFFLLLSLTAGFGSFLIFLGLAALLTAAYVLITKRRSWARLPASR